jgi:two-component system nitrogen regulation response regulator NtrX
MFPSILIVDDEPSILKGLAGLLTDEGFEVVTASNGYEALKAIDREAPDMVLLDLWMPGIDGLETLKEIKRDNPNTPVIIVTGHGNIETAVKATKLGAFDLIEKPLSIDRLIVSIQNALNFRRLEEENRYLRKKTLEKNSINGTSRAVLELQKDIAKAAPTDAWILITGENGTGKELVARSIHHLSHRADQPMIDVNCASIPEGLVESELFGHEKGAIPGAVTRRIGKFELASNGTLFFDEIGDMSLKMQGMILRVLQEQRIQRAGGSRTIRVSVRVMAASNKDLEKEIREGRFREDLFYRLNVYPIRVPPLRERREDIPVLVDIFLNELASRKGSRLKKLAPAAVEALQRYAWPGNIRELKNLLERLTIMAEADTIEVEAVQAALRSDSHDAGTPGDASIFTIANYKEAKRVFEREYIARKLSENDHNLSQTAQAIGIGRSHLGRKIRELSIY